MWRGHTVRVYLLLYCGLIHLITSTNGLVIPSPCSVSATMPWRRTNSSQSSAKNMSGVSTAPYCGSASNTSKVANNKYSYLGKPSPNETNNFNRVKLDSAKLVTVKSNNYQPREEKKEEPKKVFDVKPIRSELSVDTSSFNKTLNRPEVDPSFTKKKCVPYIPLLTKRNYCSTKNNSITSYPSTMSFYDKIKQESPRNTFETKTKNSSLSNSPKSTEKMNTITKERKQFKPVMTSTIGNSVPFAPCKTENSLRTPNVLPLKSPQACSSNFNLWPYFPQPMTLSNFNLDSVVPMHHVDSCLNSAQQQIFNIPPNNAGPLINAYLPIVNYQNLPKTDDSLQAISYQIPAPSITSSQTKDFSSVKPKLKVKSMELNIVPMPFLNGNPIQGTVTPLIKNKLDSYCGEINNNFEDENLVQHPIAKLENPPTPIEFETSINNDDNSKTVDAKLSSPNDSYFEDMSLHSKNSIQPSPYLLNTLSSIISTYPLLDIDPSSFSRISPPLVDMFKSASSENSSRLSDESLLPQICCENELTTPHTKAASLYPSQESDKSNPNNSNLRNKINSTCNPDTCINSTLFTSSSEIKTEDSDSEIVFDHLSSSESPLLKAGNDCKSDFNSSEQCTSSNLVLTHEVQAFPDSIHGLITETPCDVLPNEVSSAEPSVSEISGGSFDSLSNPIQPRFSSQKSNLTCPSESLIYHCIDTPVIQTSADCLVPTFPNQYLYEMFNILPVKHNFIDDVVLTDINGVLLPYVDETELDKMPENTFFVPCLVDIDSSVMSPTLYNLLPSDDASSISTPFISDHQPSCDVIVEPIYFIADDFQSNDCFESFVILPDHLDSYFSNFTTDSNIVPQYDILYNFPEDAMPCVKIVPIINYIELSSAYDQPELSFLESISLDSILNDNVDIIDVKPFVFLPDFHSSKSNGESIPTRPSQQNTKRNSRKTSPKTKSDALLDSFPVKINKNFQLPKGESSVTTSDMSYYVSILQSSFDSLSSKLGGCAYSTENVDKVIPPRVVAESKNDFKFTTINSKGSMLESENPLDYKLINDDLNDVEELAQLIILRELLYSDSRSNWDLLGKIINLLCSDYNEY